MYFFTNFHSISTISCNKKLDTTERKMSISLSSFTVFRRPKLKSRWQVKKHDIKAEFYLLEIATCPWKVLNELRMSNEVRYFKDGGIAGGSLDRWSSILR